MAKEELDIQKEIENYFTESTGFGRDKLKNFMDIVNKALKQKGERIADLEKENADLRDNYDQFKAIAEPEIERLKKENAELKAELTKKADTNHSLVEQMADLESENAELKEHHKSVCETLTNTHRSIREQLTKAKELLKQWLQTSKASGCDNINIVTDTEQFLNSEGK